MYVLATALRSARRELDLMPVYAIHTQKQSSYFGEVRQFGNTYHYEFESAPPDEDLDGLARFLVDSEKAVTRAEVDFIGWSTWGPTDGPEIDNIIQTTVEISPEPGAITLQVQGMYREACALCIWRLPRSPVTNRRRWLRKFLRSAPGDDTNPVGAYEGSAPIAASALAALENYANIVTSVGVGAGFVNLCTSDGVLPTDSGGTRPYFYTRQIGQ